MIFFFTIIAEQGWFTLYFTRSLTLPSSSTKGDDSPGNNYARKDYRLFTILRFYNKRVYITFRQIIYICYIKILISYLIFVFV